MALLPYTPICRMLVVLYLMACIIASMAVRVALLIELGGLALIGFGSFFLVRVVITYWRCWAPLEALNFTERGIVGFVMTAGMADSLLTYFYPLGSNMEQGDSKLDDRCKAHDT